MIDRLDFETRLEERLRARAALSSRPFDAAAIARGAVSAGGRRRKVLGLEWPLVRPAVRWLVVAFLLAIAALGAVAVAGALMRERPPLPEGGVSNGWIAVVANPDGTVGVAGDIYLVAEGESARRIVGFDGDGVGEACPRFSPEGRRLAYGEGRPFEMDTTNEWPVSDRAVVVVALNDQGDASPPIMRATLPTDPGELPCPEWSPGGRQVAYRVGPDLWVTDAVSGETTAFRVTEAPWGEQGFEWSRSGSLIAVSEPGWIRVIRIDGGASTLIPVEGAAPGSLGWTVGDAGIVYVATDADGVGQSGRVVGADGSNDTLLMERFGADLAVSPDGTRVAYSDSDPGSHLVLTMDTDGSDVVELTVPTGFPFYRENHLQWSPDGQRLLFPMTLGVVSVAVTPGSPAVYHLRGELNREWSYPQVTWQPVVQ